MSRTYPPAVEAASHVMAEARAQIGKAVRGAPGTFATLGAQGLKNS
jgi:hypothetical protein